MAARGELALQRSVEADRGEERAEEHRLARDEEDHRPHPGGEAGRLDLEPGLVRRQAVERIGAAAADDAAFEHAAHALMVAVRVARGLARAYVGPRVIDEP